MAHAAPVVVAIIIDDLGNNGPEGERVLRLPGAVTTSFLPHTPFAARQAAAAHAAGKEVMLHLPMASEHAAARLGPGGLTLEQSRDEFLAMVRDDLGAVPFVRGVNNHMGSRMTRDALRMGWLMQELVDRQGLYFVDSRTTAETVALPTAMRYGVPGSRRDVFLDNENETSAIARQFDALLAAARGTGSAIGIAHPRPATLAVLEQRLPQLERQGVRLVPVSMIVTLQQEQRPQLWQASLSPSQPAAKSLKQ